MRRGHKKHRQAGLIDKNKVDNFLQSPVYLCTTQVTGTYSIAEMKLSTFIYEVICLLAQIVLNIMSSHL